MMYSIGLRGPCCADVERPERKYIAATTCDRPVHNTDRKTSISFRIHRLHITHIDEATMSKVLLITGATGKQGGAVVEALLSRPSASDYTILAVTRDSNSGSAKKLAARSSNVKLVQGNLDDVPALFEAAKQQAGGKPIWGVFSVQVSMGKGVTVEGEIRQGKALVDEAIKHGAKSFVYSSVERGGDERSWNNPTTVEHFRTKHEIEHHLREKAGDNKMSWTILRPVAFMDNLEPGFQAKVFITAMRDTLGDKSLQFVATQDIGVFASMAFEKPEEWNHRAIGLAGDDRSFEGINEAFQKVTGAPVGTTFWFLGSALKWAIAEMDRMLNWFRDEGYKADIPALKKMHPQLLDIEAWLRQKSA